MKRLALMAVVCIFSFILVQTGSFACTRNSDGTWKHCCPGERPTKHINTD